MIEDHGSRIAQFERRGNETPKHYAETTLPTIGRHRRGRRRCNTEVSHSQTQTRTVWDWGGLPIKPDPQNYPWPELSAVRLVPAVGRVWETA